MKKVPPPKDTYKQLDIKGTPQIKRQLHITGYRRQLPIKYSYKQLDIEGNPTHKRATNNWLLKATPQKRHLQMTGYRSQTPQKRLP